MWYSETFGTIKTPRALTVEGVHHPATIFSAWSKAELLGIGIAPARVEVPDSRYYNTGAESYTFTDGEWVISYETTEKNVDDLKADLITKIKANVGALLESSDWMVIRQADGGKAVPEAWATYRSEVRTHGNSLESGVEAFASLDAIKNFQNHEVQEERKVDLDSEETETVTRTVDKTYWGWPEAPDEVADPYHVRYL